MGAVHKNFIPAKLKPQKVKSASLCKCKTLELNKLEKCIKGSKGTCLSMFFFLPRLIKKEFRSDALFLKREVGNGN